VTSPVPIPPNYTLNPHLGPVKDQTTLGACAFFSSTGYAEYLYRRFKNLPPIFSPLFGYYEGRKLDGTLNEGDCGSTGQTAFRVLHDVGFCLESSDPYKPSDYQKPPTDAQLAEAKTYSKNYSMHVLQTVDEARHAIASDYPVLIGMTLLDSFESGNWGDKNIMPAPEGDVLGGHELYVKGYYDDAKLFDIRNSWGKGWGNGGDFLMPYEYLEPSLMEARIIHFGPVWRPK
jgi:C1A family cysteine protease